MAISSLTQLTGPSQRHNFFREACRRLEPNIHLFFFCVEKYREKPSKKKAIFIFDHFVAGASAELEQGWSDASPDEAYSLLRPVNVYDEKSANYPDAGQIAGVADAVAKVKLVKTRWGKLRHPKLVADYKHPAPDLFDELQAQVHQLVKMGWLGGFDPTKAGPAVNAKYTRPIQLASVAMEKAGFNPDDLGVY